MSIFEGLTWELVAVKGASAIHRFDDQMLGNPEAEVGALWSAQAFCVVTREDGVKEVQLTDCLWNAERRLFVSPRLKQSLQTAGVTDVEYLPLKVIDRTGRVLHSSYYFLHFRNAPDCLDLDASGAKRSRAIPSKAERLERLAFKNDPGRALFRPSTYGKVTLMSWSLAEALAATGFTGMRFMGLFDFGIKGDLPPNAQRFRVDTLCNQLRQTSTITL
jgi:hypothetical protein